MNSVQHIFKLGLFEYRDHYNLSTEQEKAAQAIMRCKTGDLGYTITICNDCNHMEIHNKSCRNRNCPNCQAIVREKWVDARKAEVIKAPYFHVVFTIPAELNPIVYANQALLYGLMHKCASETILELASNKKFLGATPGIVQVLHSWGQKLNFHPHIHSIVSGGGLTKDHKFKCGSEKFFIPIKVISKLFRGKFLAKLQLLNKAKKLSFPKSHRKLFNSYKWNNFRNSLYEKDWIPYIKETFNGFGNAIEYLGRYTHRIAISNGRILKVTDTEVTFKARDYKTMELEEITMPLLNFIGEFLQHVLPSGFQKIRYYGFLNNRYKKINLKLISKLTGHKLFKALYTDMKMDEILLALYKIDVHVCSQCKKRNLLHISSKSVRLE